MSLSAGKRRGHGDLNDIGGKEARKRGISSVPTKGFQTKGRLVGLVESGQLLHSDNKDLTGAG